MEMLLWLKQPTGPAAQTPGEDPEPKVPSVGLVFDFAHKLSACSWLFLRHSSSEPFLNTENNAHTPPAQPSSVNAHIYEYFPVAS